MSIFTPKLYHFLGVILLLGDKYLRLYNTLISVKKKNFHLIFHLAIDAKMLLDHLQTF